MDYTDKKFLMEDRTEYIVVEQVSFANHDYLYVANLADEDDTRFFEIRDKQLMSINPLLFSIIIYPMFIKKFREYN